MKPSLIVLMLLSLLYSCRPAANCRIEDECIYSPEATVFTVWAGTASKVELKLYYQAVGGEGKTVKMHPAKNGFWQARVKGDQEGKYYTFRSYIDGKWNLENPGIFAKAVGINGERAAVVDFSKTNPEGWEADARPPFQAPVVYELHHRDFSIHPTSGVGNKGKFLALTEEGTQSPDGLATGIGHLKELGVTHVQMLPSFDYGSIDELTLEQGNYNWGYDPKNYNVPEGSYSTDPANPSARIKEFKEMVAALHRAGLRVVMDVVYNHTYETEGCALGRIVPNYFYRHLADGSLSNGSGCGNETASEKEMMRRFMVASVKYWMEEYHVDGFRFDLMGIHDIETMNAIRAALPADILVYGEGWAASAPALPFEQLAMKANMAQIPGVGAFSDDIRDALVGSPFNSLPAFAAGAKGHTEQLKAALAGSASWTGSPMQQICYVTCHDNYCLRDRLTLSCPKASEADLIKMDKLAQTAILTAQGIPFIFGGEEVFRTKGGDENSYRSPDSVNAIDWHNKLAYNDLFKYYAGLIHFRTEHPQFWPSLEGQAPAVNFLESTSAVVCFRIDAADGSKLWVALNGSKRPATVKLPAGDYHIAVSNGISGLDNQWSGGTLKLAPLEAAVLVSF
ncbi:MAG: type I pullulanase [Bacteroidales bacterium]|nr:type I pullulanase [Bacteroidales bacterium]